MKSNLNGTSITQNDSLFPSSLKRLPDCPKHLYIRGSLKHASPRIAIVGTRKASRDSLIIARDIASNLARHNAVIISGLALGVDAAAHKGALEAGGITWAVLANGVETIYPSSHRSLAEQLLDGGGALISEYPANTTSFPSHFLARNRIISALSDAVVIVQAPIKSGALSTASVARALDIPLFVVPGPVHSPSFAGSHMLIRSGARLVTGWRDIVSDIGLTPIADTASSTILSPLQQKIMDALSTIPEGARVDKIVEITTLNAQDVSRTLLELCLSGIVTETGGVYYFSNHNI